MDINQLNLRLTELVLNRHKLEIQIIKIDGHINELKLLINNHVNRAWNQELSSTEGWLAKEQELTEDEILRNEMRCI